VAGYRPLLLGFLGKGGAGVSGWRDRCGDDDEKQRLLIGSASAELQEG